MNARLILGAIAAILFLLAAIGFPAPPNGQPPYRYSLGWLGAFFLTLALII